jgi:alpha-L-fucosidase
MKALGVKKAVLTAKHGCGFLLWDTATKLPDGR